MTKGSKASAAKTVAKIGYISSVPVKTTVSFKGSYKNTSRVSYSDKQSGRYRSVTNKEKTSAGAFQWKNGTTATKSEYKQSSTVRFGDKSGYTEVHNEQRVRNVAYDKSYCNSKNYITYDSDDSGSSGGSDDDEDEDEDEDDSSDSVLDSDSDDSSDGYDSD